MRYYLLLFILLILPTVIFGSNTNDSLLQALDYELSIENKYIKQKLQSIRSINLQLKNKATSLNEKYQLFQAIFEEYKSYKYDSAFKYLLEAQSIAYKLNDGSKILESKIKMGFIFLSSGKFKEAGDTLASIITENIPQQIKKNYYSVMAILNYSLCDQQDSYYAPIYQEKGHLYVDSILQISNNKSYEYLYYKGLRHVRKYELDKSIACFLALRKIDSLSLHQKAIISSTMSDIYVNMQQPDKTISLVAEAAIYDIQAATKETAAILNLANILYKQGDVKRAYIYTKRALSNANFYGASHRKIQVGSILPIIEEEKINTIEKQRSSLLLYSVFISLLLLIIALFVIITLKQLKKIKKAGVKLAQTNQKLLEANKIKDDYIGFYFNNNSIYINKMEALVASLEKNLRSNNYDNARYLIKKVNIDKERAELNQNFDKSFLNLFPNFVTQFNQLFNEKERVILNKDELLNTDLRIFALIRLGIHENDKIANILDFSVNTIYTYKTKIKNKAIVPNDEFENHIMEIKFS